MRPLLIANGGVVFVGDRTRFRTESKQGRGQTEFFFFFWGEGGRRPGISGNGGREHKYLNDGGSQNNRCMRL